MDRSKGLVLLLVVTSLSLVLVQARGLRRRPDNGPMNPENLPCRFPQIRAISSYELLDGNTSTSEMIDPLYTVLHRCEDSGCCPHAHECQVVDFEELSLVYELRDDIRNTVKFQEFKVVNHTRCDCLTT